MTIQIFPDALAHLSRGEVVMKGPLNFRGLDGIWLDVHHPETIRVSTYTRREFPVETHGRLDELDEVLAGATIELMR